MCIKYIIAVRRVVVANVLDLISRRRCVRFIVGGPTTALRTQVREVILESQRQKRNSF